MINTILLNKFFLFFSLHLGQQAETIDIRTCDQAVPKGNSHLIDYYHFIFIYITLLVSCLCVFLLLLLTDDDGNGYTTHHSYGGSADVGKTIDEGRWFPNM